MSGRYYVFASLLSSIADNLLKKSTRNWVRGYIFVIVW